MEKFSKETPNYRSKTFLLAFQGLALVYRAPPTTEIPPLNCVVQRKI